MVLIKKEIRCLFQTKESDCRNISEEKKKLAGQGCLVVTMIEGEETAQKGVLEVIRSHAGRGRTS